MGLGRTGQTFAWPGRQDRSAEAGIDLERPLLGSMMMWSDAWESAGSGSRRRSRDAAAGASDASSSSSTVGCKDLVVEQPIFWARALRAPLGWPDPLLTAPEISRRQIGQIISRRNAWRLPIRWLQSGAVSRSILGPSQVYGTCPQAVCDRPGPTQGLGVQSRGLVLRMVILTGSMRIMQRNRRLFKS